MEVEKEILIIKERNKRVEADKAWERSGFRIFLVALITYIIASLILYFIGVKNFMLNALIPTVGYFLSTQSLPVIKRWWIDRFLEKKKTGSAT